MKYLSLRLALALLTTSGCTGSATSEPGPQPLLPASPADPSPPAAELPPAAPADPRSPPTTRSAGGSDPETCVVDGIEYLASDGSVYGCEGGGNWCAGAAADPGICSRAPGAATVPPELLGTWGYAVGTCRGSSFTITKDRVEYHAALEPLGAGRVIQVERFDQGFTIQTILAGEGKHLSIWAHDDSGIMAYGVGATAEQSRTERCSVMK
jgi:hypothetical protein